jgi:hypothetical protein
VETDEVTFGKEKSLADVLDYQNNACSDSEDTQHFQTEHDSHRDISIYNALFQRRINVFSMIVIRYKQEIDKETSCKTY